MKKIPKADFEDAIGDLNVSIRYVWRVRTRLCPECSLKHIGLDMIRFPLVDQRLPSVGSRMRAPSSLVERTESRMLHQEKIVVVNSGQDLSGPLTLLTSTREL